MGRLADVAPESPAPPSPPPARRQMLPRHYVTGFKRERVAAAVAEIAHERGIVATTGMLIISRAHIARNTFYDLFESREECLRYAFSQAYTRLFGPVESAAEMEGAWLTRLSLGIGNLLTIAQEEPLVAELCLVHSWGEPEAAAGYDFEAGAEALAALIAGGRSERRTGDHPRCEVSEGLEYLLASGVTSLLARRLRRQDLAGLHLILGDLVALVAGPFVGLEEAARRGCELKSVA